MTKMKNKNEAGRKAWRAWRQGNLRGHTYIGQQIMQKYGLTQIDIDDMRRETWNSYQRLRRARKKEEANEG